MVEKDVWTALLALVTGVVGAFTTRKVAEASLRSELKAQSRRLATVERQVQASTMLGLEIALALGLDGPALAAARRALVVD